MPASKYWYVRMYIPGGPSSGVKKSTRCERIPDAEEFAINCYEERLLEKREYRELGANTFAAYAEKFQEQQKRLIRRGELDAGMLYQDDLKLENDLLPYLGKKHIKQIDYNTINEFIDELHNERNLAQSTLKKYVILVRKVLKEAEKGGVIDYIPTLPVVKRVDNPRPWFKPDEY
ncbi:MAG: site-specific integrase, partial [Alphaproteobacteria bacterium]|nr:site-specific integrase [Alphaproteobacteria bacterium]